MRWLNILKNANLPNTGSVARDHLANERTFLAWLRTGVGFSALGVGFAYKNELLEALSPGVTLNAETSLPDSPSISDQHEKWSAAVLLGTGLGTIVHGSARYFLNMSRLRQGTFRPNVGGIMFTTALAVGGAELAIVMIATKKRAISHPVTRSED